MSDDQYQLIWTQTLDKLQTRINTSTFNTFFKDMVLVSYYDGLYVVATNNEATAMIMPSIHLKTIEEILEDVSGQPSSLKIISKAEDIQGLDLPSIKKNAQNRSNQDDKTQSNFMIGQYRVFPSHTFDNFVVGKSNQFAHAACLATAETIAHSLNEKKIYNPLFIYGGSGLGKTHLMHAIAQHILEGQPEAKIIYVSSENFTNELIDSIRDNKTNRFRSKYRKVDILLIDDIQFLARKEGTQEEFFHTFNELYEANKQIIISSDRPPSEIPTLEERLRTRFEWGLITDIQPPDIETRIAILRKKAQRDNTVISNEVTNYIAEVMQTNIRELEGALLSLTAYSTINNIPLDVELAKNFLNKYLKKSHKEITFDSILDKISDTYHLSRQDLIGNRRTHEISYARQLAMYLCRELTNMSLPKIGHQFGGRDHTTVIHAIKKIEQEMKKDPLIKANVQNMMKDMRGEV